jgi:D-arabinose 1-dehydrogenase-like Zn-dependent alcohol dehydrogenase
MCPLCATTAALTAATATASSTVIATWGGGLGRLLIARLRAAKDRVFGHTGEIESNRSAK